MGLIPTLTEYNYVEWAYYFKQEVVLKGWASAIDPACTIPRDIIKSLKGSITSIASPAASDVPSTTTTTTSTTVTPAELLAVKSVINERAMALIRSTVSLNCAHLIGDGLTSAMDAWLNLENAFASRLKARVAFVVLG